MALILHLDENNSNSWQGEPATNLSFLSDTMNSGTSPPYNASGY